jgi:hypothetical protein
MEIAAKRKYFDINEQMTRFRLRAKGDERTTSVAVVERQPNSWRYFVRRQQYAQLARPCVNADLAFTGRYGPVDSDDGCLWESSPLMASGVLPK